MAEKICDVWLPVVSNLPNSNSADEHVFPVFPGAFETHKRASETHKPAYGINKRAYEIYKRAYDINKRAYDINKRACLQHYFWRMNTFFPFFPALVRLISALLSFLNAFMITINALLDIESVDCTNCLLLCFGGCKDRKSVV